MSNEHQQIHNRHSKIEDLIRSIESLISKFENSDAELEKQREFLDNDEFAGLFSAAEVNEVRSKSFGDETKNLALSLRFQLENIQKHVIDLSALLQAKFKKLTELSSRIPMSEIPLSVKRYNSECQRLEKMKKWIEHRGVTSVSEITSSTTTTCSTANAAPNLDVLAPKQEQKVVVNNPKGILKKHSTPQSITADPRIQATSMQNSASLIDSAKIQEITTDTIQTYQEEDFSVQPSLLVDPTLKLYYQNNKPSFIGTATF